MAIPKSFIICQTGSRVGLGGSPIRDLTPGAPDLARPLPELVVRPPGAVGIGRGECEYATGESGLVTADFRETPPRARRLSRTQQMHARGDVAECARAAWNDLGSVNVGASKRASFPPISRVCMGASSRVAQPR